MPNQVYRFDPDTGHVRVVTDVLMRPNGIAFSQNGKIAYVYVRHVAVNSQPTDASNLERISGDTGASAGFLGRNQTNPTAM